MQETTHLLSNVHQRCIILSSDTQFYCTMHDYISKLQTFIHVYVTVNPALILK